MENTKLDNIDIESCKELFEYEMTEVILKLKGEFASVSRKDTKYAAVAVDERKLQVSPVSMPEVMFEGSVHSFAKCKSVAYVQSLPQYELTMQKAALPHISQPELHVTENIQIEKTRLDIPSSAVNTSAGISDAQFELYLLPLIKLPTVQKSLGNINNVEISLPRVIEPQKPDVAFSELPHYELKFTAVMLPSIPVISSQSGFDIQVFIKEQKVPQVTAMNRVALSKVASTATSNIVLEDISIPHLPTICQKIMPKDFDCTTFLPCFGSINICSSKNPMPNCIFEAKIDKESSGTVSEIPDLHIGQTPILPIKDFSFAPPKKIKATKQLAAVVIKSTHIRVPTVPKCVIGISVAHADFKKVNICEACLAMDKLNKPFSIIKIRKTGNLSIPTNTDISELWKKHY